MAELPETIQQILMEMRAKARSHEQQSINPSLTVDYNEEWKRFQHTFLGIEPNFDFKKADNNILSSIFAWVWKLDKYNVLRLSYDKGLFLYGSLGRGKSLTLRALQGYMNSVSNRHEWKKNEDYRIGMRWRSASELANAYAGEGQPALTVYYDWETNLCIDELGREPNPANNFGTKLDVIQFLLQMRYDHRRTSVTHITTNLTLSQMNRTYGDYVADRCLEMFNFIEFKGKSFRR